MEKLICPNCSKRIWRKDTSLRGSFRCPSCQQLMHFWRWYAYVIAIPTVAAAVTVPYFFGFRDWAWLLSGVIVYFVAGFILQDIFPPRVELEVEPDQRFYRHLP